MAEYVVVYINLDSFDSTEDEENLHAWTYGPFDTQQLAREFIRERVMRHSGSRAFMRALHPVAVEPSRFHVRNPNFSKDGA